MGEGRTYPCLRGKLFPLFPQGRQPALTERRRELASERGGREGAWEAQGRWPAPSEGTRDG